VNRYREEFAGGLNFEEAMARAIQTAGRTVLFSALTVALSVAALAIVPLYFLRSFAYTAIAVVIAAAAAGLLVVPALIVLLGNKLEAFSIRYFARRLGFDTDPNADPARSVWYRWTRFVMQHAALVAVAVVSALLFLGHPFVDLRLGSPDEHVLPLGAPSRQAAEIVKRDFPLPLGNASYAVLPNYSGDATALEHYSSTLSSVTDVQAVLSGGGVYIKGQRFGAGSPSLTDPEGSVVIIASAVDPYSVNGTALLSNLKRVPSPSKVLFGGPIAQNTETIDVVATCLPYVIGIVIVVSLLLLLLFTGSLLLPFKALIVNGLSLTATFGSMVWIFQEGHLSKVLGITPTGTVAGAIPILMFCLAFGMSMDYEVFLLSRIREEWLVSDQTPAANAHAVATGVALTGRIFTAAALLMAIVFASLATSGVSFMKMFGIGLALAVIMDATVVRACLVPAVMQLTRRFNWWLPSSLRAIHARFGLEE
jgi:RND superfamily putative drug exporter